MERKDRIDLVGAGMLLLPTILFALNQVLVKLVNAGLQPVFQAGMRSLLGIVPLLLFAWFARRRLSVSDGSLGPGLICGLLFSGEFMLLFLALDYTTVSRVSVIFYTMPVWLTIGAHFLVAGERLTMLRTAGLAVAVAGVVLAISSRGGTESEGHLIGDSLCVVASMLWAAIALIVRTTDLKKSSPEMQLLYQLVVSSIVLLPASLLFGELIREMTPFLAGVLVFQVIGVVMFGFLTWFWVLSIYPASDMASFTFLIPVFGVFFGWILLDETVTPAILIALLLVCIGIVLINRKPANVVPPARALNP